MSESRITITIDGESSSATMAMDAVTGALGKMGDASTKAGAASKEQGASVAELAQNFFFVVEAGKQAVEMLRQAYEATVGAVLGFAEANEKLGIMAEGLGITAEKMKVMRDASYLLTGSSDTLNSTLLLMGRNLGMAAQGIGPAADALYRLGINAGALQQLSLDDQFTVLAEALGTVSNQSEKLRLAQELFGRGFREIIPLLKDGGQAFKDAQKEAAGLGYTLDEDLLKKSEALVKASRELNLEWEKTSTLLKASLIPFMIDLVRTLGDAVRDFTNLKNAVGDWWSQKFGSNNVGGMQFGPGAVGRGESQFGEDGGVSAGTAELIVMLGRATDAQRANWAALDEHTAKVREASDAYRDTIAKSREEVEWKSKEAFQAALGIYYDEQLDVAKQDDIETAKLLADQYKALAAASRAAVDALANYLPAVLRTAYTAFRGNSTDAQGNPIGLNALNPEAFTSAASGLNSAFGTTLSGGALAGGAGAALALLMQNPVMQAEMAKLNALLQDLITPLAQAIAPALDELAPIMRELRPVFVIIADVLRVGLLPMVAEIHALNQIIKPLADAINRLKNAIESWNPFGGGSSGSTGHPGGVNVGGGHLDIGGTRIFDSGGLITPADMLGYNPATGHGLIIAQAGEHVVNQRGQGGGPELHFHITALDPKTIMESLRRMLEEQHALGRLGVS